MIERAEFRTALLAWYDANRRTLAWREDAPDPYRVWLSEIMLQQTTVPHATPYFLEFVRRWPTVRALAAADDADVMAAWAGLGYYARARNLLACARQVVAEHGGKFPPTQAALLKLKGIGAYTAAAIASIAFGEAATVVDGNVERVISRLYAIDEPLPASKTDIRARAEKLTDHRRPGDWAQAMMDLGAVICRPKSPLCDRCPVSRFCEARKAGDPETYPRKAPKPDRPRRYGIAYVMVHEGMVQCLRRPPKGLLGGMLGLPTTDWTHSPHSEDAAPPWRDMGQIEHVFTHFSLTLRVFRADGEGEGDWMPVSSLRQGLPSVFRNVLNQAWPS